MKGMLGAGLVAIVVAALPFGTVAAQTPTPLYEPKSDVEKAAAAVLTTHCARCHQAGQLKNREKPAKGFGNVLQLDQLAADPSRILPGNPDGSRLFKLVVDQNMPFDRYQDGDFSQPSTTEADIAALRSWIASLQVACQPTPKTYASLIDVMTADIGRQPDHRRHGTRYVTLTHLSSNCSTEAEMNIYRQGVIKLLNSLSRSSDVVKLETADEEKSIIRINIDDLGWSPGVWDLIASRYPYGVRPANSQFDALAHATGAQIPFVRGDWLAFTAARPPLYHEILNLPDRFERLQADQGVDVQADIERLDVQRAGFQRSGVSRNNRMIERHTISTGAFWASYDFAGNRARQNLFEFPLGPGGEQGFSHDGGETIFNLPNGFQAYYLNTADGRRLDQGPTNIVQDPGRRDLAVTNGISCMGCHESGMINATDEVRDNVSINKSFPLEVREAVRALYPGQKTITEVLQQDRDRFLGAMKRAGLDTGDKGKLNGVEMVNALSNRYERDLDLSQAAAEFGAEKEETKVSLIAAGGTGRSLVLRLEQATVPRDQFEAEFAGLVENVIDAKSLAGAAVLGAQTAETPPKAADGGAAPESPLNLTLFADAIAYRVGDKPIFTMRSDRDCQLTLVNIDPAGQGTVIFPNRFAADNRILGNRDFVFPDATASFDFKFSAPGTETVIAICDVSGKSLPAVQHDFSASAFTDLGPSRGAFRKIDVFERPAVAASAGQESKPSASGVGRAAVKLQVQ